MSLTTPSEGVREGVPPPGLAEDAYVSAQLTAKATLDVKAKNDRLDRRMHKVENIIRNDRRRGKGLSKEIPHLLQEVGELKAQGEAALLALSRQRQAQTDALVSRAASPPRVPPENSLIAYPGRLVEAELYPTPLTLEEAKRVCLAEPAYVGFTLSRPDAEVAATQPVGVSFATSWVIQTDPMHLSYGRGTVPCGCGETYCAPGARLWSCCGNRLEYGECLSSAHGAHWGQFKYHSVTGAGCGGAALQRSGGGDAAASSTARSDMPLLAAPASSHASHLLRGGSASGTAPAGPSTAWEEEDEEGGEEEEVVSGAPPSPDAILASVADPAVSLMSEEIDRAMEGHASQIQPNVEYILPEIEPAVALPQLNESEQIVSQLTYSPKSPGSPPPRGGGGGPDLDISISFNNVDREWSENISRIKSELGPGEKPVRVESAEAGYYTPSSPRSPVGVRRGPSGGSQRFSAAIPPPHSVSVALIQPEETREPPPSVPAEAYDLTSAARDASPRRGSSSWQLQQPPPSPAHRDPVSASGRGVVSGGGGGGGGAAVPSSSGRNHAIPPPPDARMTWRGGSRGAEGHWKARAKRGAGQTPLTIEDDVNAILWRELQRAGVDTTGLAVELAEKMGAASVSPRHHQPSSPRRWEGEVAAAAAAAAAPPLQTLPPSHHPRDDRVFRDAGESGGGIGGGGGGGGGAPNPSHQREISYTSTSPPPTPPKTGVSKRGGGGGGVALSRPIALTVNASDPPHLRRASHEKLAGDPAEAARFADRLSEAMALPPGSIRWVTRQPLRIAFASTTEQAAEMLAQGFASLGQQQGGVTPGGPLSPYGTILALPDHSTAGGPGSSPSGSPQRRRPRASVPPAPRGGYESRPFADFSAAGRVDPHRAAAAAAATPGGAGGAASPPPRPRLSRRGGGGGGGPASMPYADASAAAASPPLPPPVRVGQGVPPPVRVGSDSAASQRSGVGGGGVPSERGGGGEQRPELATLPQGEAAVAAVAAATSQISQQQPRDSGSTAAPIRRGPSGSAPPSAQPPSWVSSRSAGGGGGDSGSSIAGASPSLSQPQARSSAQPSGGPRSSRVTGGGGGGDDASMPHASSAAASPASRYSSRAKPSGVSGVSAGGGGGGGSLPFFSRAGSSIQGGDGGDAQPLPSMVSGGGGGGGGGGSFPRVEYASSQGTDVAGRAYGMPSSAAASNLSRQ